MDTACKSLTDKLCEPRTTEALTQALDTLTKLHESGALDSFVQAVQAFSVAGAQAEAPKQNPAMSQVAEVVSLMTNALTDRMVEQNAAMMGELLNIAHESADPCVADALREVKRLQTSGNLKVLSEASDMVAFLSNAVTDTMVQRLTTLIATFVEEISTPHVQDSLRSMTECLFKTVHQFAVDPPKPGMKTLIGTLRDPEVQMGMMFMATLAKNMHRCMIDTYEGRLINT